METPLEVFDGFETATIDVGETSIFVRRKGSGRPLLLLHGFPETHLMWHAIAPALADEFAVVCADLRGYGGSGSRRRARITRLMLSVRWRSTWCG